MRYSNSFGAWLLAHPVDIVGLIDWCIFILLSRESDGGAILWTNSHSLRSYHFPSFLVAYDFFPHKFAACSKPPSRDNHRKASYSRTQKREQDADWTHDHAIRVIVKTTLLPSWPRCRHSNKPLPRCFYSLAYKFNNGNEWVFEQIFYELIPWI